MTLPLAMSITASCTGLPFNHGDVVTRTVLLSRLNPSTSWDGSSFATRAPSDARTSVVGPNQFVPPNALLELGATSEPTALAASAPSCIALLLHDFRVSRVGSASWVSH